MSSDRRQRRWYTLTPVFLCFPLLGCLLGECTGDGNPCTGRAVCTDEGQCGASGHLAGDSHYRCFVRDTNDCRASAACSQEGRCEYDPRVSLRCITPERRPSTTPAVASVCDLSSNCARWGRCELVEGACLAVRDEDCKRSLNCVVTGRCSLRDKYCVATSDADCASSLECDLYGRCVHDTHPFMGAGASCSSPGQHPAQSCSYDRAGAEQCAQTGECLMNEQGVCETLDRHHRRSPELEEARRRIREAIPIERPTSSR